MTNYTNRRVFKTKDGSNTLYWPKYDEHFHSIHGAFTESKHVFITAGLEELGSQKKEINIFEMGFGTGLNALLTFLHAKEQHLDIHYTSIDAFPLEKSELQSLQVNQILQLDDSLINVFYSNWNRTVQITDFFSLQKVIIKIEDYHPSEMFDLIYYDAFAPSSQPELWTINIFEKMYKMLNKNGILTTYCAKGQVKRDLKSVGFILETLPGPPGKREMIRARKL